MAKRIFDDRGKRSIAFPRFTYKLIAMQIKNNGHYQMARRKREKGGGNRQGEAVEATKEVTVGTSEWLKRVLPESCILRWYNFTLRLH